MTEQWRDRFVRRGMVDPGQLVANGLNWRIHPHEQGEALDGVLDDVGWVGDVAVQDGTDVVIDGHLRVERAMARGEMVPCSWYDLSDGEVAVILATYDSISAMAGTDKAKLDELLREVKSGDSRVQQMLSDLAAKSGLDYFGGDPADVPVDVEPDITRADELREKWQTESGQVWRLGPHLLLIGDSTERANVERVMGGEEADLVFTDPPYGVAYVGKTRDALQIQNDALGDDATRALVGDALRVLPLRAGASFYICSPAGNTETAFRLAIMDAGLELRECLVWVKQQFVMGRQDYHWRHESILYGWKDGAAHYFVPDRTQDTVWEIDRPHASREHPTMKPVDLICKAINNSSLKGQIVFDGFAGSGSTLAACSITGRTGRAIELDPRYGAVIIERMTAMGMEEEQVA